MRLAIIPARGGSKRIPRKNIRVFAGKPMIAWPIETAVSSGLFDRIIVSSDSREIQDIAKDYGAEAPFDRPGGLSNDHVGTMDVVRHAIAWCERDGFDPAHVCCIYATAPFLRVRYLKEGLDNILHRNARFSFSVTSFPFPIQRAIRLNEKGRVEAIYPENMMKRSQDVEDAYHDAGQFYWGDKDAFMEKMDLFSTISIPVILPRHLVQDIDTPEDWIRAEYMFKTIMASGEFSV